jgi:hypothetical protein
MNNQDTYIYDILGNKIGDFLSPFLLDTNYGYLRKLMPEDKIEDEDDGEHFEYGYFSTEGTIVAVGTTKESLINQVHEENLIVLLIN